MDKKKIAKMRFDEFYQTFKAEFNNRDEAFEYYLEITESDDEEMEGKDESFKALEKLDEIFEDDNDSSVYTRDIAEKALKIDPNCLRAKFMLLDADADDYPVQIERLLNYEEKRLRKEGIWPKENMFRKHIEASEFLDLKICYMNELSDRGRSRLAIRQGEEILELQADEKETAENLLMLYCRLERLELAQELFNEYEEHSIRFLFPMVILYLKEGMEEKALDVYRLMQKEYPQCVNVLRILNDLHPTIDSEENDGIQNEVMECFFVLLTDMVMDLEYYCRWLIANLINPINIKYS